MWSIWAEGQWVRSGIGQGCCEKPLHEVIAAVRRSDTVKEVAIDWWLHQATMLSTGLIWYFARRACHAVSPIPAPASNPDEGLERWSPIGREWPPKSAMHLLYASYRFHSSMNSCSGYLSWDVTNSGSEFEYEFGLAGSLRFCGLVQDPRKLGS